ncbi:MAG: DUF4276 family protein [Symploca sp. SIO1B1]|nr:DUF4276 family protein [Symploca sp. SIO1C2]NES00453.1 DUF4276 family protein [Symploca sp. SIO1B1]
MSNFVIALIAEDDTDCNTVKKIVHRVLGQEVKIKKWASKGSSTLKRKLTAKLKAMSRDGCNAFIIIHDLDRNPRNNCLNDETQLRRVLEQAASTISDHKHICIPIEELEAWFWSDPGVVQYVGKGKGKAHPNPHLIVKPKEKLIELSIGENRKPRYSTNMNVELAGIIDLEICSKRCPSFKSLLDFLYSL